MGCEEEAVFCTLYRSGLHIQADARDEMLVHREVFVVEIGGLLKVCKLLMGSWVPSTEVVGPNASPVLLIQLLLVTHRSLNLWISELYIICLSSIC